MVCEVPLLERFIRPGSDQGDSVAALGGWIGMTKCGLECQEQGGRIAPFDHKLRSKGPPLSSLGTEAQARVAVHAALAVAVEMLAGQHVHRQSRGVFGVDLKRLLVSVERDTYAQAAWPVTGEPDDEQVVDMTGEHLPRR